MTIRTDLLRIVATHLRHGHLGHERFNYAFVNDNYPLSEGEQPNSLKPPGCGTNGCAMGELPIIFPKEWAFRDEDTSYEGVRCFPCLLSSPGLTLTDAVREFFGLDKVMEAHLFYPGCQHHVYGGRTMPSTASREEVADHIDSFCNWAEANA